MAAEADIAEDAPAKKSKLPLILGLVFALVGGGGGFFAVSSGLLLAASGDSDEYGAAEEKSAEKVEVDMPPAAFIPLDPLVVSIPSNGTARFLRFTGQLEVAPEYQEEVTTILPRVVDVMNGYLRAVELSDLEDPTILTRLRAQLLRRVQVVAGPDRVKDLLIMEFVLN